MVMGSIIDTEEPVCAGYNVGRCAVRNQKLVSSTVTPALVSTLPAVGTLRLIPDLY